jgi:hypothetical protein
MKNFKNWLLTEELYLQNNTAVVYHRTKDLGSVSALLSQIFDAGKGGGCALGCGLYTMIDLESQFQSYASEYGKYITKWKISGLENFLVLTKNEAMKIHGPNHLVSSQLKKFNVLDSWKQTAGSDWQEKLNKYDQKTNYKFLEDYNDWCEKNLKGAIYMDLGLFGPRHGLCIIKYPPVEDGVTFLGYAESDITVPDKYAINNLQWHKTMKGTSVKSLYQAKSSGRDISNKVIQVPPLTLTPIDFAKESRTFKLSPTKFIYDSITKTFPNELIHAIINKQNPPIVFKFLDESQWHAVVKTTNNIFSINGIQIAPNNEVPINSGDKLCVQTKTNNYCFVVGQTQPQTKTPTSIILTPTETNKSIPLYSSQEIGKNIIDTPNAKRFMEPVQFTINKTENAWTISHNPEATNKTTVNGNPIISNTPLKNGDVIALGKSGQVPITVSLK